MLMHGLQRQYISAETRFPAGGDDSAVGLRKTRYPSSTETDVITALMHKPVVVLRERRPMSRA